MTGIHRILRSRVTRFSLFVAALAVGLTLILAFQLLPNRFTVQAGEVSAQTLKSPVAVTYISELQTEAKRQEASASVRDVVAFDPGIARQQLTRLQDIRRRVLSIISSGASAEAEGAALKGLGLPFSDRSLQTVQELRNDQWEAIVGETQRVLEISLAERIQDNTLAAARQRAVELISPGFPQPLAEVVTELVRDLVVPTVVVDRNETERLRRLALDSVEPVRVTLERGETIIRDGEVVRPVDLEKLRAAGLLDPTVAWTDVSGVFLLSLLSSLLLASYIAIFHPELLDHERRLILLGCLFVGTVLAAKLTIPSRDVWAIVFPFAAGPMVIATLLDAHLAVVVSALLSLLISYSARGTLTIPDLHLALVYFAGGLAGVFTVRKAERLQRFFVGGAAVTGASFAVLFAFWLINQDYDGVRLGFYGLATIINGLLSSVGTIGVFVLLGMVFGIATTWHLLELAQPNQPLLRRLLTEAPGTYHHSIIVGNLAERAAEAIGADSLLVRVGAHYHDVGKMLRPGYFIENQLDGANPHFRIDPETSARVIVSHVTDGINLAKQYRLPGKVRDFIPQHHGTRLATYFYAIATQKQPDVDPEIFRYPGPKPQSKETAIVMLADSTEATVRASPDHSPEEIDELVEKTVSERVNEGQFDECDLTFKDIERIKQAFKTVLRGVYHPRIEYPEPVKPAQQRAGDSATAESAETGEEILEGSGRA